MSVIVTKARTRGIMAPVPAAITVWMVDLGPASGLEEVQGSLALASDALVFTPRSEGPERRFTLREVVQARRLRGSPILMIATGSAAGSTRTAFYFVQPPPLERSEDPGRLGPFGAVRSSRRRVRRQNATYLGSWNREKKGLVREWEREVRAAAEAARGPRGSKG
jgi:hypothetical protein